MLAILGAAASFSVLALLYLTLWLTKLTGRLMAWALFAAGSVLHVIIAAWLAFKPQLTGLPDVTQNMVIAGAVTSGLLSCGWLALIPVIKRWSAEHEERCGELIQLQQITDSIPLLLIELDMSGRIRYCNVSARKWFRPIKRQPAGLKLVRLLVAGARDSIEPQLADALDGNQSNYANVPIELDGDLRHFSISYLPMITVDGEMEGLHLVAEDVTEVIQNQALARAAELKMTELKSIRSLAATAAHEINNPLAGIVAYSQMLAEEHKGDGEVAGILQEMLSSAKRIHEVTDSLMKLESVKSRDYPTGSASLIELAPSGVESKNTGT